MSRLACDATLLKTAEAKGTPTYVYDLEALAQEVRRFRAAVASPALNLLFATMANPAPEILTLFAREQVGACVNSVPHLHLALAAGMPVSRIQFTASGLSPDQMRALIAAEVRVNLDSRRQIAQWLALGGGTFGVRLNAGSLTGQPGDRLGLDPAELAAVQAEVPHGALEGLHVYIGTNFLRAADMFPTLRAFFRAARDLPDVRYVNVGGGVGVDYARLGQPFDLQAFGAELANLHADLARDRDVALFFEPGRGLAAASGVFLSRVTDVKALNGVTYVACDGSVAIFPRPFHQPDSPHRVRTLNGGDGDQDVVVVGRTTFSRDILARCRLPAAIEVGDILAFEDSGAYCSSMASRFLGQPEPAAVYFEPE